MIEGAIHEPENKFGHQISNILLELQGTNLFIYMLVYDIFVIIDWMFYDMLSQTLI